MTFDTLSRLGQALQATGKPSSDYDLNPDVVLPPDRKLRPAGVLIAIRTDLAEPQVILTKRSSSLKHHPGQIACPGGKQDDTDTDVVQTALREAQEEVGVRHVAFVGDKDLAPKLNALFARLPRSV